MNSIRSLPLKKIFWILIFLVSMLTIFLGFKSWLTGKQLTQQIEESVLAFNANNKIQLVSTVKEDNLFSQKVGFELVEKAKKEPSTFFEGELLFNHSPLNFIFGKSSIEFSGEMNFLALTHDKLDTLASAVNANEVLIEQLLPFLKPEAAISIKLSGNLNGSGLQTLILTSENFSSLLEPKAISTDELTLSLNRTIDEQWRLTLSIPSIVVKPIKDLMDEAKIDEGEDGNAIAKISPPHPNSSHFKGLTIVFDIVDNKIKLANVHLDTFTNNQIAIEDVILTLNAKDNERLRNYEWQFSANKFLFQDEPLGQIEMHASLENVSYELMQQLIEKAHLRYTNDKLSGKQRFSLPVYYFAQWLNSGEDILSVRPSFTVHALSFKEAKGESLNFKQNWQFHSKNLSYDKPFNSLSYLPFYYTEQLSFNLSLTQNFLERVVSLIQKNYLYDDKSLTVDKLLFSLNQMNQTHPFFITDLKSSLEVTPADLLDKDANLRMDFKFDSQTAHIEWNGQNYTNAHMEKFIENLF